MSDFINAEVGHRDVYRVEKSLNSKNKCDLSVLEGRSWKVTSDARGKEMLIIFQCGEEIHKLKVQFGRVGQFRSFKHSEIDTLEFQNNAIFRMYTRDRIFAIYDFTRLSLWRWADWDLRARSPDILTEYNAWIDRLYDHRHIPYFTRPIFQLLCDQRFFNGVDNFLRTEILCRTKFSPFISLDEVLKDEYLRKDFFETCRYTLESSYLLGGLQFEHWKNPFKVSKKGINSWIRSYKKLGKSFYLRDVSKRIFWFEKRWIPDYIKWVDGNDIQDTRLLKKIYRHIDKHKHV